MSKVFHEEWSLRGQGGVRVVCETITVDQNLAFIDSLTPQSPITPLVNVGYNKSSRLLKILLNSVSYLAPEVGPVLEYL